MTGQTLWVTLPRLGKVTPAPNLRCFVTILKQVGSNCHVCFYLLLKLCLISLVGYNKKLNSTLLNFSLYTTLLKLYAVFLGGWGCLIVLLSDKSAILGAGFLFHYGLAFCPLNMLVLIYSRTELFSVTCRV